MSTPAEDFARTEFYIRLRAVHPVAFFALAKLNQDVEMIEKVTMYTYTTGMVIMNGYATEEITRTMTPFWYRKRYEVWYRIWRESGTQYQFEYFKR